MIPFMSAATVVHGVCTESRTESYPEKIDGKLTGKQKQFTRVCIAAGNTVYEIGNVKDDASLARRILPGNAVLLFGQANKYENASTTNIRCTSIKVRDESGNQVELLSEAPQDASANVPGRALPPRARQAA
jgi:hypothetical protein